jgi:hypothetical protein
VLALILTASLIGVVPAGATPVRQAVVSDTLRPGEWLTSGQSLSSPNGSKSLIMQTDGNLVLYGPLATVIWASGTVGHPGASAVMQTDGNFVIYEPDHKTVWASNTEGNLGARLVVQDDGNVVILRWDGRALWASMGRRITQAPDTLRPNDGLAPEAPLVSASGNFRLVMQTDGNLVVYGPGSLVNWASNTNDHPGAFAVMQQDGNFVIYVGTPARPIWASGTFIQGSRLVVQDDSYLAIVAPNGSRVLRIPTTRAPFDLTASSVDDNGFLLNPKWAWQIQHPGSVPDFSAICRQGQGCVTQPVTYDPPNVTGFTVCGSWFPQIPTAPGLFGNGHLNWQAATYTGTLTFANYSGHFIDSFDPGGDEDYNLALQVPGMSGLTTGNLGGDANGRMWLEYNSKEPSTDFQSHWWSFFREQANNGQGIVYINNAPAIVTGLVGLDTEHGDQTELHPVYAMAARVNGYFRSEDWAYFVRNTGNEGFCSSHIHPIDFPNDRYVFRIPWKQGAVSVQVDSSDYSRNAWNTEGPNIEIVPPSARPQQRSPGVYVSFGIETQARCLQLHPGKSCTSDPRIDGFLRLYWDGSNNPPPKVGVEWLGHPAGTYLPLDTPLRLIVHAIDPGTGALVNGTVSIEKPSGNVRQPGLDAFQTNTPFTTTLKEIDYLDCGSKIPGNHPCPVDQRYPTAGVDAVGYGTAGLNLLTTEWPIAPSTSPPQLSVSLEWLGHPSGATIALKKPVHVIVHTRDAQTHALVKGDVAISNPSQTSASITHKDTNVNFTTTFIDYRFPLCKGKEPEGSHCGEVREPSISVSAPGYQPIDIPLTFK